MKNIREVLFGGWSGCSNHGCIVKPDKEIGTNTLCRCVMNASRGQLNILQGRLDSVITAAEKSTDKTIGQRSGHDAQILSGDL